MPIAPPYKQFLVNRFNKTYFQVVSRIVSCEGKLFIKGYISKTEASPLIKSKVHASVNRGHVYAAKVLKAKVKLDPIFNAITDPIVMFDTEFNVTNINKAAKEFFVGHPIGKKCFFTKHKFALACKNCPTWQTIKTGKATTSEILNPKTNTLILLKTYPIYNRLKNIKGAIMIGRESTDVTARWKAIGKVLHS